KSMDPSNVARNKNPRTPENFWDSGEYLRPEDPKVVAIGTGAPKDEAREEVRIQPRRSLQDSQRPPEIHHSPDPERKNDRNQGWQKLSRVGRRSGGLCRTLPSDPRTGILGRISIRDRSTTTGR